MARTDVQGEMGWRRKGENDAWPDSRHQRDFIEKGHYKIAKKTEAAPQMFTKENLYSKLAINKKTKKN